MHAAPTSSSISLSTDALDAARGIESWLLGSDVQIPDGMHRGGVAGWLDRDGCPEFVYLEITGYYLTAMAWLAEGGASSPDRACAARVRGRFALDWLTRVMIGAVPPPTRLHLTDGSSDWRNGGRFTFDLAMAARGLATAPEVLRVGERRAVLSGLCGLIDGISAGARVLRSHDEVGGVQLPGRWSTRPGPHHLKAAAGLLRLPARTLPRDLRRVCLRTCDHWSDVLAEGWPCAELHALLYGLEGMLIRAGDHGDLRTVARIYERIMEFQAADGTLPETLTGGTVRADVLAQGLRIGTLLRLKGHLSDDCWSERLVGLAAALLEFVEPDGGVRFALDQDVHNAWCAMFAHQALMLFGGGVSHPDAAIERLV